jgi:DHA1 family inner membrane transport protein
LKLHKPVTDLSQQRRRVAEDRSNEDRQRIPIVILAVVCGATFLASASGMTRAPFLLAMARDLQTDLATVASLFSLTAIAWGAASLAAGIASDRWGRKLILIGGLCALGVSLFGVALAQTYLMAASWCVVGGFGGGAYMGTIFAEISDHVVPAARGRALGWIITGQSLALVLGVPLATLIGSIGGWRGVSALLAVATFAAASVLWRVLGQTTPTRSERPGTGHAISIRRVLGPPVIILLCAAFTERVSYGILGVYFATYLLTTYGVPFDKLALALALVALGNLAGNAVGSVLADRVHERAQLFATTSIATGLAALPMLLWHPALGVSIVLGFTYALVNALGRPALMVTLAAVPERALGTVMGLNITCGSFGWICAATVGSWLISQYGFGSLGIFTAILGMSGATLALWSRRLARARVISRPSAAVETRCLDAQARESSTSASRLLTNVARGEAPGSETRDISR